ncbi:MAG: hypothetical protein K8963_09930, partial [Proteobacteria bacterium]|nr:hypothetical protein [Pseudomonadota bacterium]
PSPMPGGLLKSTATGAGAHILSEGQKDQLLSARHETTTQAGTMATCETRGDDAGWGDATTVSAHILSKGGAGGQLLCARH